MVAEATSDGGIGKKKKKRRPGGGGGNRPGPGGDDEDWINSGGGEETEPPKLIELSAADRGLEWRGDDTSPRKTKLDMGNNAESRSLDNGEIQNAISSQSGGVQSCVMKAATNTDLSGTITVKMVVEGNGKVARSRVQAPRYLFSQGLLGCVQGSLRGWSFPSTGAPTLVTLPVNFH
ncbi:MAG TPA: AgmX/PglI C-terminal domain-containing protein [Kofleriaceae bacterium]